MRPHLLSSVQEGSEHSLIARSGCWDQQSGKVEKVYRDISPKTLRALWKLVLDTKFLVYEAKIGRQDIKERSEWVPDDKIITEALTGEAV